MKFLITIALASILSITLFGQAYGDGQWVDADKAYVRKLVEQVLAEHPEAKDVVIDEVVQAQRMVLPLGSERYRGTFLTHRGSEQPKAKRVFVDFGRSVHPGAHWKIYELKITNNSA